MSEYIVAYQVLGWTNVIYYIGVVSYSERVTQFSTYYTDIVNLNGYPRNSKWLTQLGIRFLTPVTVGLYALLFLIGLTWGGIYNKFYSDLFRLSEVGFFGLNIVTTFWDDIYRGFFGKTRDAPYDDFVLSIFGVSNPDGSLWHLFPEFEELFIFKVALWVSHLVLYTVFRSAARSYIDYRIECNRAGNCTSEDAKTSEKEVAEDLEDIVDIIEF